MKRPTSLAHSNSLHGPTKSNKIINFGSGRIRPRARLIRTIGAELISSEIVAVLELVRNSYDADASRVEVRFTDPHIPGHASIAITDDGHGMDQEILLGPWLEPATDHKALSESTSTSRFGGNRSPRGRRRVGSKGVGRFAAQRLGHRLVVSSSTGGPTTLEADFDWVTLDRPDRYLDQLRIPWREVRSSPRWHGTSLLISSLRDGWTATRFERLRLALARLLGPGLGGDPFRIDLVINGVRNEIRPAIETLASMYCIEGSVSPPGVAKLAYSDALGTVERWERSVLWPAGADTCGPFKIKIKAWDLDREPLQFFLSTLASQMGPREFRRTIHDHSGISLYRDGFRILPYGEPDNDWLRLDRRRVNNPTLRLSNNQILGWIQISGDDNRLLQDQTNREGLVSNDAYSHLQQVVLELLSYLEARRFAARRSAQFAASRPRALGHAASPMSGHDVEQLLTRLGRTESLNQGDVATLRSAMEAYREQVEAGMRRYSGLAATGQLASLVLNQVAHPIRQVQTELSLVRSELDGPEFTKEHREALRPMLHRMERRLAELRDTVTRVDPMARPRGGRKLVPVDLQSCWANISALFADEVGRKEVDFQVVGRSVKAVLADSCVIEQVAAILMENALYWVTRAKGRRSVCCRLVDAAFVLENNGPPVPPEHSELVFAPHYTTREDASGLGLPLARDLLEGIGARIRCVPSSQTAVFEVTFAPA